MSCRAWELVSSHRSCCPPRSVTRGINPRATAWFCSARGINPRATAWFCSARGINPRATAWFCSARGDKPPRYRLLPSHVHSMIGSQAARRRLTRTATTINRRQTVANTASLIHALRRASGLICMRPLDQAGSLLPVTTRATTSSRAAAPTRPSKRAATSTKPVQSGIVVGPFPNPSRAAAASTAPTPWPGRGPP